LDPENKLLSHWSIRRLEAEAIRDSIVTLSGKFDPTPFGESADAAIHDAASTSKSSAIP
jgi:hypothetical protein